MARPAHVPRLIGETMRARRKFGDITEAKLERWFGGDCVDALHLAATGCYVPVPIMGIPMVAYRGMLVPSYEPVWAEDDRVAAMTGFASLSDLISEAAAGKRQSLAFNQVDVVGVVGTNHSTWGVGPVPAAGSAAAAPPGGTVSTRTTTGALGQQDPGGADTLHVVGMNASMSIAGALMLQDRLFSVTTAANPGTGSISVTGAQTRYLGAAGTADHPGGVVITNRVTVVLPATAHNITYTYTDQDNNASASSGANVGRASSAVHSTDFQVGQYVSAFAGGDSGARQLTAIQFSASPATGQVEHSLIRPLALCPCPIPNVSFILDGINSAFNLMRVMTGACLTFSNFQKSAVTATSAAGLVELVSG